MCLYVAVVMFVATK